MVETHQPRESFNVIFPFTLQAENKLARGKKNINVPSKILRVRHNAQNAKFRRGSNPESVITPCKPIVRSRKIEEDREKAEEDRRYYFS